MAVIEGLDELILALGHMSSPEFADGALKEGLFKGAKLVQGTSKQLCAVDSGQLRNSIEVTEIEDGYDTGTNVEHGPHVEFGTGKRGDPSVSHNQDWPGMNPQPFLYPALKANEGNIVSIVKNTLENKIARMIK